MTNSNDVRGTQASPAYSALLRLAALNQVVYIRFGANRSESEVKVTLREKCDNGLLVETDIGTEWIAASDVHSWRLPRPELEGDSVGATAQQTNQQSVVAPTQNTSTAAPNVDQAVVLPSSNGTGSRSQFAASLQDLELLFSGSPSVVHPQPSFDVQNLDSALMQNINRWKNRYDYAMKVHEPARVSQDVPKIAELGESLRHAQLMCLAGTLAYSSGLGSSRSMVFYKKALEFDPTCTFALLGLTSIALEQNQIANAAGNLLRAIEQSGGRDCSALIRVLGQCVARLPRADIPPVGPLLSCPFDGATRRLANSLVALAAKEDQQAFYAALAGSVEQLRRTRTGNDLFPWVEEPVENAQGDDLAATQDRSGHNQIHPRRGRVSAYYPSRKYGFIVEESTGQTWFFHKSNITSGPLLAELLEGNVRQEVAFTGNVEIQSGKYPLAEAVAVLSSVTTPITAPPRRAPLRVRLIAVPRDGSAYARAKEAEQLDQLTRAEELFRREIQSGGGHVKSAIKDLSMLLHRKGDSRSALQILDEHRAQFDAPERSSLDQIKVQLHVKLKEYKIAAELLASLADHAALPTKRIEYLRQEAYCYYAAADYDAAIIRLETLLKRVPKDNAAVLLLARVREAKQSGIGHIATTSDQDDHDVDDILTTLALGLSTIARRQLDACELRGIDARTRESRQFSEKDFHALEKLLEGLRGRRPRERADYMLTLASLCDLCPEGAGKRNMHSLLRAHFAALAEAMTVEDAHRDVVRCYTAESLCLCPVNLDKRLDAPFEAAWALLLRTYNSDESDLSSFLKSDPSQRLINAARALTARSEDWQRFAGDVDYYRLRMGAAVEHLTVWLQARRIDAPLPAQIILERQRLREDESAFAAAHLDVVSADKLREAREALARRISDTRFDLDKTRLRDLVRIIGDAAEYALERHFRERETRALRLDTEIARCVEEWQRFPTHLSIERMVPVLANLRELLKADYGRAEDARPSLELRNVLDNDFYIENDGLVALKLLLTSRDESAPPIEAIGLLLNDGDHEPCHSPEPLHGGQSREIELAVRPTDKQLSDGAFAVEVIVEYRMRNGLQERTVPFPLAVRLGEPAFEEIHNPYGRYSGGSPVEDEAMFFGRAALIKRIVQQLSMPSAGQCFVLYGQKRSGKSSVLKQAEKRIGTESLFVALSAGTFAPGNLWRSFALLFVQEIGFRIEDRHGELPTNWPQRGDVENNPMESIRLAARLVHRLQPSIVVAIDEFTYLFEHERSDVESFMRGWKALLEARTFNALLVGQDTMPRFKQAFPNEFGVTHDERISYLEEDEAARLAAEPILLSGASRYRGQAQHRLFRLTAGSPFFLQIYCDRLVRHLNTRRAAFVTEADIEQVARSLTVGADSLPPERFDALVTAAGENVALVPRRDLWNVLARVARESLHSDWCYKAALTELANAERAVSDLIDREILATEGERVSIRVGLFAAWLRANYQ